MHGSRQWRMSLPRRKKFSKFLDTGPDTIYAEMLLRAFLYLLYIFIWWASDRRRDYSLERIDRRRWNQERVHKWVRWEPTGKRSNNPETIENSDRSIATHTRDFGFPRVHRSHRPTWPGRTRVTIKQTKNFIHSFFSRYSSLLYARAHL